MRTTMFILIFSIVILIYFSINYYIYSRALMALPANSFVSIFKIGFWVIAASYVIGRFLERVHISILTDILTWVGSFWLALMLYFFLVVLVIDIIRILNYFIHFLPPIVFTQSFKSGLLITLSLSVSILVGIGHINAITPKIRNLSIQIDKKAEGMDELNVVLASDIHMGTVIGPRRMGKFVEKVNALKPEIILLAGDIVDEDLEPVVRFNLGEVLSTLKAPLGVYGITGNHEYIGGVEKAVEYLEAHNIKFLRDSMIKVADAFYIVGREDRSKNSGNRKRKDISTILKDYNPELPVIMLDHQPFELNKVVESGVDIQFSGHTHNGQLWPLNLIIDAMYEVGSGYRKIGNTHFYVSNGYGSWGPPVRIGNRPEIVNISIKFKK